MGSSSGGSKEQKVTSEQKLPEWLDSRMQAGASRAEGLYQQGMPDYFPGSSVVPFSQQTQDAMGMTEDLARSGAGVQPALGASNATLGGDYLFGGEGFNAALDAANAKVLPSIQSAFSRSGRSGSGLAQEAVADAVSRNFASLYDNERGRMQGAMGMAPQMAALQYMPAQMLGSVGAQNEEQAALELQDEMNRYNYEQNAPAMSLDQYLQRIQGIAPFAGGTTTQTTPLHRNKGAGILGGALSGAQMGSAFGPWGAAIGAAGGGLLGGIG